MTIKRNIDSFFQSIDNGNEPRRYTFDAILIPVGEYEAKLDFKIWSKKVAAINCYFTKSDTNLKIQLTVYCNKAGHYQVANSNILIDTCPIGVFYKLIVNKNSKGKLVIADISELK